MKVIREAFFNKFAEAAPASEWFVSLYERRPFYGGPEEGGWWGQDIVLIASQKFHSEEAAEAAASEVEALSEILKNEEARSYGEQCKSEMDWLEARGLESDFLPEPNGPVSYFVRVEEREGASASVGHRHWE